MTVKENFASCHGLDGIAFSPLYYAYKTETEHFFATLCGLKKYANNKFILFMIFKLNFMYYYRGFFFSTLSSWGGDHPLRPLPLPSWPHACLALGDQGFESRVEVNVRQEPQQLMRG